MRTYSRCDASCGRSWSSRSTRALGGLPVVVFVGPLGFDFDNQCFAIGIKLIGHGSFLEFKSNSAIVAHAKALRRKEESK